MTTVADSDAWPYSQLLGSRGSSVQRPPRGPFEDIDFDAQRRESLLLSLGSLCGEVEGLWQLLQRGDQLASVVDSTLREFLRVLGKSFDIEPQALPRLGASVSAVTLTPEGYLFLRYIDEHLVARSTSDLSPESILNVLAHILPEAALTVEERWRIHYERAAILGSLSRELIKISSLRLTDEKI
jgi:hypothetical protein